MARHFFSYRGTAIQRSQEGLIRGLLHQLCTADPELLPLLCTRRWNSPLAAADQDWSLNELLSALHRIAKVPGACFCFFVDGLDEYEAMSGSETSEKALELLGEAVIELAKLISVPFLRRPVGPDPIVVHLLRYLVCFLSIIPLTVHIG